MPSETVATLRAINHGFDPSSGNWTHRGLDLSTPQTITAQEKDAFRSHYAAQFGHSLDGLDWWLDRNPEVLKRYRLYSSLTLRVEPALTGNGTLTFYALRGHVTGVRYVLHSWLKRGVNQAQALEMLAIAFIHAGPRGMEAIQEAARDIQFPEVAEAPARFPEGWAPDLEAFRSGLDFSTVTLDDGEKSNLYDWYLRTIGEIPPYVRFLAEHRPMLLKTHRARMENMLYVLPKQFWPTSMLYYHVMSRVAEGIRENVLLCKAWGVSRADTLDTIGNALVYGQMEAATMIQREAGDVFDGWSA
ncbi:hypothetical protein [Novosphingobium lindaniclasticum]|uniref:Uncharacterized protein n=1 Tax=Novosphingobium lindaniclasticum LE124 TaxID=1096930 RepID=T0IR47_9SPHN|nr:hypothetical protein [Novosphingobium lindaniclasticum]EQB14305.1 hypothetical protein L284_12990 [Novosphingobium lindaniclasticum LE124]